MTNRSAASAMIVSTVFGINGTPYSLCPPRRCGDERDEYPAFSPTVRRWIPYYISLVVDDLIVAIPLALVAPATSSF